MALIISMKCMIHVPGRVGTEECSLDIFKLETDHLFFPFFSGWGQGLIFFPSA